MPYFPLGFPASNVFVDRLSESTYSTLQQFINTMHSPGTISGGEITVISATQVRVAAGTGMIRSADDDVSSMPFFDWAQTDFTVPADDVIRYFGVVYNGGSPLVAMRTTEDWDKDREIPLGAALHISTNGILVLSNPYKTGDPITNIIQRFDASAPVLRDAYVGGLIIGTTGTRNIVISAGQLWHRLNDSAFAAFDSSAASRFTTVYYNPTTLSWVYTPSVAQWPNGQYNNTSSGTGLDAITGNRYVNLWFYIGASGQNVFMVYGQAQHVQLADAFAEGAPTFLPPGTAPFILLVGKLTFQNGAATPTQLLSPFTAASLGFGSVNTHNDLSGLQGGTTAEYYHLTNAAYVNISAGVTATPQFAQIGVGGAAQSGIGLSVEVTANDSLSFTMSNDTAAQSANLLARRRRMAGSGEVQNGDRIGQLIFRGYNATSAAYNNMAFLRCEADAAPSGSITPGRLLGLVTRASDGAQLEVWRADSAGLFTLSGAIQTAAPSGSTAPPWKFGAVNAVSPTAPNRTVAIDVNGTVLYLHAKTTND